MTPEDRQKLRELAHRAVAVGLGAEGSWELQTSNSWRRIGTNRGDGDILCPTNHRIDHHPDLSAPSGVLDYIVAAQPAVVLELLDVLDRFDRIEHDAVVVIESQRAEIERQSAEIEGMRSVHEISELIKVRDALDVFIKAKREELR